MAAHGFEDSIDERFDDVDERSVFVGGLSEAVTDELLRDMMSACGTVVEARVIVHRTTRKSRGFGFVTFDNRLSPQQAIAKFSGMEIEGRPISVKIALHDDMGKKMKQKVKRQQRRHAAKLRRALAHSITNAVLDEDVPNTPMSSLVTPPACAPAGAFAATSCNLSTRAYRSTISSRDVASISAPELLPFSTAAYGVSRSSPAVSQFSQASSLPIPGYSGDHVQSRDYHNYLTGSSVSGEYQQSIRPGSRFTSMTSASSMSESADGFPYHLIPGDLSYIRSTRNEEGGYFPFPSYHSNGNGGSSRSREYIYSQSGTSSTDGVSSNGAKAPRSELNSKSFPGYSYSGIQENVDCQTESSDCRPPSNVADGWGRQVWRNQSVSEQSLGDPCVGEFEPAMEHYSHFSDNSRNM